MKNKNVTKVSLMTLVMVTILVFTSSGVAMAAVWTDQLDYSPGSVVTISGDNSDNAGYVAGETVNVSVNGPYLYDSKCSGIADMNGAWSCHVTLSSDYTAEGSYTYVAVGQTSGVTQSGTFSDSVISVTMTSPTTVSPITIISLPASVTISFNYATSSSGTTTGQADVLGTSGSNTKNLASGSGKSDSIVVTIPTGTVNGNYNAKVTVTNNFGSGANNKNDVQNGAIIVNVPTDTTPPVITPSVSGTLGSNGWYKSDVVVSWAVNDPESTVTSTTGCGSTTINTDTSGTTRTCSATSAGGTSSQSVTIKRDVTPPTITVGISPSPASTGWYNSVTGVPTVSFTCSDTMSGLAGSCPGPVTLGEGAGQSVTRSISDNAGSSASDGKSGINVDTTSPVITISGNNPDSVEAGSGTYSDVGATVADNIDTSIGVSSSGMVDKSVVGSYIITYTATDDAGNVATVTRTVKVVDTTSPVVTITAPSDGGYYKTSTLPGLAYTATDVSSHAEVVYGWSTDEGVHTVTITSTDASGNVGSDSVTYTVDNTPPVVTINAPMNGYYQTVTLPTLAYTVTDNLDSGPGIVESGWSTSDGVHTVAVTATDKAGNVGSDDVTYTIDNTKPEIGKVVTGTIGDNGWYVSDVTVDWTVNDPESGIVSSTGCDDVTLTSDTTGVTYTCTSSNGAGLENSDSVTIKVDKTKPDVLAAPDRSADHNGWYSAPVTISFSGTDGTSGIESCDSAVVHNSDIADETISGNCKDKAGNVGTGSFSLKYDGTAPTIAGSRTPSANVYGWNNGDVTVHFECGDALSGIDSCNSDVAVSTEGSGQSATGTVTDVAGNTASAKVEDINIDKTAPTISGSPTTSPNGNGWYNSDVTVHFECGDGLSGVVDSFFDVFFPIEGEGQSVSRICTDKAGNSADSTVSGINIDKTPPEITGSRTPSPNTYGWNNGDVTVHFAGSDSLSGVGTITPDTVVYSEGAGQSVEGTVVDKAGNIAKVTVGDIDIDKTAPTIVPSAKLIDDSTYTSGTWANKDVTVEFSCSDSGSGVDSCGSPVTKSGEGAGQSVDGTVVDKAGNTASATFGGINIDKTPPEITGAPTTSPNSKGWYNSNVVVHFVASDALAGIGTLPTDVTLSGEGAGQSATGTTTDKAGNSASITVSGINIDKTGPVVTINVPVNGNVYILNQNVIAEWATTDAISGIDSATGTVGRGSPIDTSTVGPKTFKVTATDNAGNTVEKTVTYTIQYLQTSGHKILQPLQQVSDPSGLTKAYKLGSTLPVKFQLSDYNGAFVGTAKAIIAVYKTSSTTDLNDPLVVLDSGSSNDNGNIFRYDSVAQQYIYNLNTKNLAVGTFRIDVTLDDGTRIMTFSELRK